MATNLTGDSTMSIIRDRPIRPFGDKSDPELTALVRQRLAKVRRKRSRRTMDRAKARREQERDQER
jgi:hypothetical protein